MSHGMRSAATLAFLAILLAGCSQGLGSDTYTLSAEGVPATVAVNTTFDFTLQVQGDMDRNSDHVGADYWAFSTDDPTEDRVRRKGACTHLVGEHDVPGTFDVSCTFVDTGTLYLRGHVRVADGERTFDYWTPEHVIQVEG